MSIKDELNKFDDEWKGLPDTRSNGDFTPLPDGLYQAEIDQARVEHSKGSGRLQLTLVFRIHAPNEFEGRTAVKCTQLDDDSDFGEMKRGWVKQDLFTLGIQIDSISNLPEITTMIVGSLVEINLKSKYSETTGETYQNVFVNKLLAVESDSSTIEAEDIEAELSDY